MSTSSSSELNIQKEDTNTSTTGMESVAAAQGSTTSETAPAELAVVVDDLLNQLSTKFATISQQLISKMDDMSQRLDNLETTIQASAARSADRSEEKK